IMQFKIFLHSVIGGAIITLVTGLISNNPRMLIGAMRYGYPFSWLIRRIIAPQYFPWRVDLTHLIVDIVIWSIVVGIIIFLVSYFRSRS
ncbi:MAG: hypothetical protein NWE90_06435, partial [Candidatus Bathyarchaeota archaeon]|nr:hypothetical protein [Candidatus Bathyarchaeota archaeon]